MDFNELHLSNIYYILVTFEVSKLDKSIDFNELHQKKHAPHITYFRSIKIR